MTDSAHILVVDNYDSFVYTIVGYLQTLGATVDVVRNDAIDPAAPGVLDGYDGVLISPGPGAPAESGASEDMIRLCAASGVPMFGVCLGLQALAEVYGCTVDHAPTIMHGKTSLVEHIDDEIFEGVANPMTATRYHSLAVEPDSVPGGYRVDARRPHYSGRACQGQADVRRAIPSRIRDDPGRLPSAGQLAQGLRPRQRRGQVRRPPAQSYEVAFPRGDTLPGMCR